MTAGTLGFHLCEIFTGWLWSNTATICQILSWKEGQNSRRDKIGSSKLIRTAETNFWVWTRTHEVLHIVVSSLFLVAGFHDKFLPNTQVWFSPGAFDLTHTCDQYSVWVRPHGCLRIGIVPSVCLWKSCTGEGTKTSVWEDLCHPREEMAENLLLCLLHEGKVDLLNDISFVRSDCLLFLWWWRWWWWCLQELQDYYPGLQNVKTSNLLTTSGGGGRAVSFRTQVVALGQDHILNFLKNLYKIPPIRGIPSPCWRYLLPHQCQTLVAVLPLFSQLFIRLLRIADIYKHQTRRKCVTSSCLLYWWCRLLGGTWYLRRRATKAIFILSMQSASMGPGSY